MSEVFTSEWIQKCIDAFYSGYNKGIAVFVDAIFDYIKDHPVMTITIVVLAVASASVKKRKS